MTVGNVGFSAGMSDFVTLKFSNSGEPYVVYQDYGNSGKATVMKYIEPTTGVNDFNLKNGIKVFPNPTKNQINFSIQTNAQLTNVTGQIVADRKNVNHLDLSDQPTGIYFLTLTDNKGQVLQRSKIVKE